MYYTSGPSIPSVYLLKITDKLFFDPTNTSEIDFRSDQKTKKTKYQHQHA